MEADQDKKLDPAAREDYNLDQDQTYLTGNYVESEI